MDHTFDYELMSCIYDDVITYSKATEDSFDAMVGMIDWKHNGKSIKVKAMASHKMTILERIKRFLSHLIDRIRIWVEKIFRVTLREKDPNSVEVKADQKGQFSRKYSPLTASVQNAVKALTYLVASCQMIIYKAPNNFGHQNSIGMREPSEYIQLVNEKIMPDITGAYERLKKSVDSDREFGGKDEEEMRNTYSFMWKCYVIGNINRGVFRELEYTLSRLKESVGECQKAYERERGKDGEDYKYLSDTYIKYVNTITSQTGRIISKIFQPWEG